VRLTTHAHIVRLKVRGPLPVFRRCLHIVINRERTRVCTSHLQYYRGSVKFVKGVAVQMMDTALGWKDFPCLLWSDRAVITLLSQCIKCRDLIL
jgi:hypothetical protein